MSLYASELEHLKEWLPAIAQILTQMREHSDFSVSLKGHNDLVTTADLWSENKLIELINNHYPNDAIWAEETHHKPLDLAGRIWIIDPIDGTTNFAHGFAPYCISVALWKDGQVVVGMVYEMAHHQCF
ncbi:MAG: inositol monophosphatase family protein, partial [Bacteroidota bacterium]